jgi:hypothetical protein
MSSQDQTPLQINGMHFSLTNDRSAQQGAKGKDNVLGLDGTGNDSRKQRRKEGEVFPINKCDLDILLPAKQALQAPRGVDAAKAAAQDRD